ncbi:unnamed protein product [Symbiodinium necroappetens]|uniref:Uncharacterized protein n=1 Tax=Symbiodinium necroappetens TaxID=1628268 RepID=A0A812ZZ09_9DINO|nr:unnamed protein product [Symbiodinium necroappetens]
MALACLKTLATEDPPGLLTSHCSENRFAFTAALAKVLAAMGSPAAAAAPDRPKKKPPVTDFASAVDFLEQAIHKGPGAGAVAVGFRSSVCLAVVLLAEAQGVSDAASLSLVVRALPNALDMPGGTHKGSMRQPQGSSGQSDEETLMQVARQISMALHRLLRLAEREGCLNDFVEQGLLPVVSAQFNETSRGTDMRMLVVLETLCGACVASGEAFRSIETKVTKPLLHIVGNYPQAMVQLQAVYCLRCIGRGSPPQLFQLLSVLLNLSTVQNAEVLGTPLRRRDANGQMVAGNTAVAAAAAHADLQPLIRGLFGHCAALAAMSSELYSSELGVPHDVTSAVLGTSGALLQPHPSPAVSAQRRCCAFLLLEGLMCLGSDWVGQRLTTLFALWKSALGKKPVDRAKVVYQEHVSASQSKKDVSTDLSANVCRDELLSLLFALRSLYAFTWHSRDTLLTSLPHLHKILVVFLTNISQLVVALPHPSSSSFRAKYAREASGPAGMRPIITMSANCNIPEILLSIRATMYRTFAAMQPSLYSSRFVPLLNMLADDVARTLPSDYPFTELVSHFLHRSDIVLDLVDVHLETSRECATTTRLGVDRLLSVLRKGADAGSFREDAGPFAEDQCSDGGAACLFSPLHRESPGAPECLLTPWDAWCDCREPLAPQCVSAEWDWRCSSVKLLAIIMNAAEVGENPRAAVLQHLLKVRRDAAEEGGSTTSPQPEVHVSSSVAVLAYLREHVRMRGLQAAPPAPAMEQVLQSSLSGLKESNPLLRRLHAEILALLFFVHHQLADSPIVPNILQQLSESPGSDSKEEKLRERSALALLCGCVLRCFSWGWRVLSPAGDHSVGGFHCPYIMNIVPALLKLAKETAQPVRLWMLYSLHLGMQAARGAFMPFMKDSLRLATAHLLADFFEAPLVLWVVSELTHSAAVAMSKSEGDVDSREEHLLAGIWRVFRHVEYLEPSCGNAFAMIRAEVVSLSTAPYLTRIVPPSSLLAMAAGKLSDNETNPKVCCVRTHAAQCLWQLATTKGCDLGSLFRDRTRLFRLLDASKGAEAEAFEALISSMLQVHGLHELPTWLQALRQVVLALPPKGAIAVSTKEESGASAAGRKGSEDRNADEIDDEAAMAGPKQESGGKQSSRIATKVFAVSCLHQLLDMVPAGDPDHFQPETSSPAHSSQLPVEKRFMTHLELLVGVAVNAASSDEASLSAAGLRLMLLIIQRFQHTKDVQGQIEGVDCPLLLVQFEAQVTTCIRHNLRASANPSVMRLALELLRDVIAVRACTSSQRLIALLMQPFASPAFEPDPLFSEAASTGSFLFRLRCAAAVLDSSQSEQVALRSYAKDLARWIELALRDGAVLLAGLPLQNVKTYQPACFNFADCKAIQPLFRAALPSLLRGVCALCADVPQGSRSSPTASPSWVLNKELTSLALGIVVTLMAASDLDEPIADLRVFVRTIRHILAVSASGTGQETLVNLATFLDVMGCVWRYLFLEPSKRRPLLLDLLELIHVISGALWDRRQSSPTRDSESEASWLDALSAESAEGAQARATLGAYAFHIVSAAMNSPEAMSSQLPKALEVLHWWLRDALPRSLEADLNELAEAAEDDLMVAALAETSPEESTALAVKGAEAASTAGTSPWLWLLFFSPFPERLVQHDPATTLKYWKQVCGLLATLPESPSPRAHEQLFYLAMISCKMTRSLIEKLKANLKPLDEAEERNLVYAFATLVPAVTAMASVRQCCKELPEDESATGDEPLATSGTVRERAEATVQRCLLLLKTLFDMGWSHPSVKVAQAAISSAQNLLQNSACTGLCMIIVPGLVSAMASPEFPPAVAETAWGALPAMLAAQHQAKIQELVRATTQLILQLVSAVASYSKLPPGAPATAAMARCLMQVAQIDQAVLKTEVGALPADSQRTVQDLMRAHMTAGRADPSQAGGVSRTPLAEKKIELKLKF